MDNIDYLKIFAKILQIISFLLSSAAILGENRLKKIEIYSRKLRRLIQIRFISRIAKPFISILIFVFFTLCLVISFPIMVLTPSSAPMPSPVGVFLGFMLFAYLIALVLYIGMAYIITSSVSGDENLRLYSDRRFIDIKNNFLVSDRWKRINQSVLYKIAYYSLFPPVVAMAILPLQTIGLLLKKTSLRQAFKFEKEKFEQFYLPSSLKSQEITGLERIGYSLSLRYYKSLFLNSYFKKTIILFLYPFYFTFFVPLVWIMYHYWLFVSFFSTIYFGVVFCILYLFFWVIINISSLVASISLYILFLPYKFIELFRLKIRFRSTILTIAVILGLLSIFLD